MSSQMFLKQRKRKKVGDNNDGEEQDMENEYYCAVGTEGYMAPELLLKGRQVGKREGITGGGAPGDRNRAETKTKGQ